MHPPSQLLGKAAASQSCHAGGSTPLGSATGWWGAVETLVRWPSARPQGNKEACVELLSPHGCFEAPAGHSHASIACWLPAYVPVSCCRDRSAPLPPTGEAFDPQAPHLFYLSPLSREPRLSDMSIWVQGSELPLHSSVLVLRTGVCRDAAAAAAAAAAAPQPGAGTGAAAARHQDTTALQARHS